MIGYQSCHMLTSKGIDVKKNNGSHECVIFYHFYFEINFGSQPSVRDGCHDLMQKVRSFNDAAIVSVKRNYYRFHFLV